VNNTKISVFQRKRPRGDWMNVKMTGMAGESPVGFVKGMMSCKYMCGMFFLLLYVLAFWYLHFEVLLYGDVSTKHFSPIKL